MNQDVFDISFDVARLVKPGPINRNNEVLAVLSYMAEPVPPTPTATEEIESQLSPALTELSNLLANKEYVLATAQGDGELSTKALNAVKSIFDLGKPSLV